MRWIYTQRERWFLWIPVLIGLGIILYSTTGSHVSQILSYSAILLLFITGYLLHKKLSQFYILFISIMWVLVGYALMQQHSFNMSSHPIIKNDLGVVWIRADIEDIEQHTYGKRIMLRNVDLWQPEKKNFSVLETPYRIRLNIRTDIDPNIKIGDRVALKAVLSPPPKRSTYPDAYDFSSYAFYEGIGATGYSISSVKLFKEKNVSHIKTFISNLRQYVTKRILAAAPEESKNIATALLTGERSAIDTDTLQSIRNSGLGHLLAISGLHIAIIMAGIYTLSRFIFALLYTFCLYHNCKKIAAINAIFCGFLYLCLTGFPISAQRAYIMACLFFMAILIDRKTISMRILAVAATIILILSPASVLHVSFQMSFAAVTALIAFFERPIPKAGNLHGNPSIFERLTNSYPDEMLEMTYFFKIKKYVLGIILSSVVATMATMPFAIYHFGHFAIYGVVANLIAIPLTTLWIMPWGMLCLVLIPFGMEQYALYPMHLGIEALKITAQAVNAFPSSNMLVAHISQYYLSAVIIGGLWLCLWQHKLRVLGAAVILLATIIYFPLFHRTPDIIINEDGKLYAIKAADGQLYLSSLQKARYARRQWLQMTGNSQARHIRELKKYSPQTLYQCDNRICSYTYNGKDIAIIQYGEKPSEKICDTSFLVVNLLGSDRCKNRLTITRDDLQQFGTHAVYLSYPFAISTVENDPT